MFFIHLLWPKLEEKKESDPYLRNLDMILKNKWTPEAIDAYRKKYGHSGLLSELVEEARSQTGTKKEI